MKLFTKPLIMKYLYLFYMMTSWFTINAQSTDKADEKSAIENTIRDYIEGWYKSDTIRMDRFPTRRPCKANSDAEWFGS